MYTNDKFQCTFDKVTSSLSLPVCYSPWLVLASFTTLLQTVLSLYSSSPASGFPHHQVPFFFWIIISLSTFYWAYFHSIFSPHVLPILSCVLSRTLQYHALQSKNVVLRHDKLSINLYPIHVRRFLLIFLILQWNIGHRKTQIKYYKIM